MGKRDDQETSGDAGSTWGDGVDAYTTYKILVPVWNADGTYEGDYYTHIVARDEEDAFKELDKLFEREGITPVGDYTIFEDLT